MTTRVGHVLVRLPPVVGESSFRVALDSIEPWTGALRREHDGQEEIGPGSIFHAGTILFGKLRPYLAKVWVANREGVSYGDFLHLAPRSGGNSRYLGYLMRSRAVIDAATAESSGSKMPRTEWDRLRLVAVPPIPAEETQRHIADYLDRETAEVDAFLTDLTRMRALTTERLQSLVAKVAEGWNSSADKIHWHYRVRNGLTPKTDDDRFWLDGDIPWVNSSVVHNEKVTRPSRLVTDVAVRSLGLPVVPKGSLLIGLTGEGKTRGAVTTLDIDSAISQHVAALTRRRGSTLTEDFLRLVLTASYEDLRTQSSGNGGTKGAITCQMLQQFRVPVPARTVQREAVQSWSRARAKATAVSADIDAAIALAKERRAALITAAVTGAIDVTAKQPSTVESIERAIEGLP